MSKIISSWKYNVAGSQQFVHVWSVENKILIQSNIFAQMVGSLENLTSTHYLDENWFKDIKKQTKWFKKNHMHYTTMATVYTKLLNIENTLKVFVIYVSK